MSGGDGVVGVSPCSLFKGQPTEGATGVKSLAAMAGADKVRVEMWFKGFSRKITFDG